MSKQTNIKNWNKFDNDKWFLENWKMRKIILWFALMYTIYLLVFQLPIEARINLSINDCQPKNWNSQTTPVKRISQNTKVYNDRLIDILFPFRALLQEMVYFEQFVFLITWLQSMLTYMFHYTVLLFFVSYSIFLLWAIFIKNISTTTSLYCSIYLSPIITRIK